MHERGQVYDTFWKFSAERLGMYMRRLRGEPAPWTSDRILSGHRFTNAYRATDRVSQFLIREVQYAEHRSQAPAEVFFRTLLFKLFNRVETWALLEAELGPISWQSADLARICEVLDKAFAGGTRLYSAAYIMPAPAFGHIRKHGNHLALLERMMQDGIPSQLPRLGSLREVYDTLLSYPGLGRFLAFQYTIDLNYSSLLEFEEADFVVAGPGAIDGLSKCFEDLGGIEGNRGKSVGKRVQHKLGSGERMSEIGLHFGVRDRNDTAPRKIYPHFCPSYDRGRGRNHGGGRTARTGIRSTGPGFRIPLR